MTRAVSVFRISEMVGPWVEDEERPSHKNRDQFTLEVEPWNNVVSVQADLYQDKPDREKFVWGRTTGIKLQPESIPALIALLSNYQADAACYDES